MIFVIVHLLPSIENECSLADIPIMVKMQLPRADATRSVGEKFSPLPLLSTGASVVITLPDLRCRISVLKSPRYFVFAVSIAILISLIILLTGYPLPSR
jgi:hypothetical protein